MDTVVANRTDELLAYLDDHGGAVEAAPGRPLLRAVADDLGWSRAEVAEAVAELEAAGLAAREVRDRRAVRLAVVGGIPPQEDEPAVPTPGAAAEAPVDEAAAGEAPPAAPGRPAAHWTAWSQIAPPTRAAAGGRFAGRGRARRAAKAPKGGSVYEVREMDTTTFVGLQGTVLSRHGDPGAAFAEIRRLNTRRSGGRFTPRVVVRVDPDGTEDVAIPFNDRARPVHFDYTLPGGRV